VNAAKDVDAYIEGAPERSRPLLGELRRLVLDALPGVSERIAYGMPAYALDGRALVHMAAARTHVAVYGLVHADADVPDELAPYLTHRSTLAFRFDRPLPAAALTEALRRKAGR
jgi:uncharacterized protein YdhG (YjbR/CyaY superfamily)